VTAPLSTEAALVHVARGGLVAFPTETTWGLGADARSGAALARLRAWKGRDAAKPLSVLVAGLADLARLGARLTPAAERLARAFWPGPLTLVVRCEAKLADGVGGRGGALGLRGSPHPGARALATLAAERGIGPLTATSLNHAGAPDCRTRAEAIACAGAEIPCVDGADAGGLPPSSVVDATGADAIVLREGALSRSALAAALRGTEAGA
jgi:L-threonylcarbamoyladenylate synthase